MKIKKLSTAMIILAVTLVVYMIATVMFCYTTKPKVAQGEFPFSITYEYKGETKTLSGVLECEYSGSCTILNEHNRYWDYEIKYDNPEKVEDPCIIDQSEELQTLLSVQPSIEAGYLMGDPLYKEYGLNAEPYIQYYDYINDIILDSENQDEVLQSIGFKIVDFTYDKPIENSFSFAGVSYEADNILIFVAISLVYFLACLIFVRKDKEYKYNTLDIISIILNFLIGIFALPFITIACVFFGLVESNLNFINQMTYNIPPIAVTCLALSGVLRRKGFSKTGFFIQFGGILLFIIILVLETVTC